MTEPRYLSARLLQSFGVGLLMACAIYWGITKEQSALFVSAALSLIGAGSIQGFRVTAQLLRDAPPTDPTKDGDSQ